MSNMEASIGLIQQLAAQGESGRPQLMTTLHNLAHSLETPHDTIHRYGHANLQTSAVKIGMDLGLFKVLAEANDSLTVADIAQRTGAEAELTNRLLRFLASVDAVEEVDTGRFAANKVAKNLAEKLAEAGISHYFGSASPLYQALPGYLKRTGYKSSADQTDTATKDAFHTPLHIFAYFGQHPELLAPFNDYMALRRTAGVTWLGVYPVKQETEGWPADRAVFVNVGGGIGHQCAEFKESFPEVKGKVVLQDLAQSIERALPTPGVNNMVHDFFEPQPIQGAKFYHMRGVLHNHPPHRVRLLLKRIKSAMTEESILLVEEMIIPEKGVHSDAASIDITMLAAVAGKERTEAQWRETFREAKLELVRTYTYNAVSYESVMDVRLARAGAGAGQ